MSRQDTNYIDIHRELNPSLVREVEDCSRYGKAQYGVYRKRGLSPFDAYKATLAWARNAAEQAERRKSHGTGCT